MIPTLLLLLVFAVHLVAFVVLGLRRRERYYISLIVTFSLLTAAMAARLAAPDWMVTAELELARALRMAAWAAAAVSIGWTVLRIRARRAQRRQAEA